MFIIIIIIIVVVVVVVIIIIIIIINQSKLEVYKYMWLKQSTGKLICINHNLTSFLPIFHWFYIWFDEKMVQVFDPNGLS